MKNLILFMSIVLLGVACNFSDSKKTSSSSSNSIVGTWGGCAVIDQTNQEFFENLGMDENLNCGLQAALTAFNFTADGDVTGSIQYSCNLDCTGGEAPKALIGTYTIGNDSSAVAGAKDINLDVTVTVLPAADGTLDNVDEVQTIYTIFKLENGKLRIGNCMGLAVNVPCSTEESRASSLLTGIERQQAE